MCQASNTGHGNDTYRMICADRDRHNTSTEMIFTVDLLGYSGVWSGVKSQLLDLAADCMEAGYIDSFLLQNAAQEICACVRRAPA